MSGGSSAKPPAPSQAGCSDRQHEGPTRRFCNVRGANNARTRSTSTSTSARSSAHSRSGRYLASMRSWSSPTPDSSASSRHAMSFASAACRGPHGPGAPDGPPLSHRGRPPPGDTPGIPSSRGHPARSSRRPGSSPLACRTRSPSSLARAVWLAPSTIRTASCCSANRWFRMSTSSAARSRSSSSARSPRPVTARCRPRSHLRLAAAPSAANKDPSWPRAASLRRLSRRTSSALTPAARRQALGSGVPGRHGRTRSRNRGLHLRRPGLPAPPRESPPPRVAGPAKRCRFLAESIAELPHGIKPAHTLEQLGGPERDRDVDGVRPQTPPQLLGERDRLVMPLRRVQHRQR